MRILILSLCLLLGFSALQAQEKKFVSVPVSVSDRDGRYISGLKKDDFTILRNGKEQKITFFETENEPVSVALLIDTSESTKNVLGKIRDAANEFIAQLNGNDECLIASFNSELKVLNPLTGNLTVLKKSLDSLETDEREGTIVYSAVNEVINRSFSGAKGRKVVVLLSDGKDFGSKISKTDLLGGLEESDVMIYSIFYQTGSIYVDEKGAVKQTENVVKTKEVKPKKEKKKGYSIKIQLGKDANTTEEIQLADKVASKEAVNVLQEMSDATAGRFYMSDAPNLSRIFKQIAAELREQYRLGFNASDVNNEAEINDIIVKVSRPEAVVRARGKYRAGKL